MSGNFHFEVGKVSRSNLLHTYVRRLSRVPEDSALHRQTEDLIQFLRDYPFETLTMISIRPESGGFQLFLADENSIVYWMEMFSRG